MASTSKEVSAENRNNHVDDSVDYSVDDNDFKKINNIFARAVDARNNNPTAQDVFLPFKEELIHYKITFSTASYFDALYFGCRGEYWVNEYNNPCVGDKYFGSTVSRIGLLTFELNDSNDGEDNEYDYDEYYTYDKQNIVII